MRQLERFIERIIDSKGGFPFIFSIPAICDEIVMGYIVMEYFLPSHELIVNFIKSIIQAHSFM